MSIEEQVHILKSLLAKDAENNDKESILKKLQTFIDGYKHSLPPNEMEHLQLLMDSLVNKSKKYEATFYEYILFVAVVALMACIFGEKDLEFSD